MLIAELITLSDIYPIALFIMVAAVSWWALDFVATGKPRAVERLDELKNPRKNRGDARSLRQVGRMTQVLETAAPALAQPLTPKSEAEMGKLRARLAYAGFRGESASSIFLAMKFAGLVGGLMLGSGSILPFAGLKQSAMISVIAVAGVMFYIPDLVVWYLGKRRMTNVFLGLPDALDLMVVCVEAGLGLDQAMRKVAEEMRKSYPVIAEEFSISNFQLQMGRPRGEVLHELGMRNGVADLRALATVLIQADKFGSSVATALRVQSDSMRTRRRQLAEEKAAKTAVKLIFPLVLFIFPGIFVVLVGPAAITIVREMFPKMRGG